MKQLLNNEELVKYTDLSIDFDGFIHTENIDKISSAISKAQMDITNPKKSTLNPYFKSKYSNLSDIINVIRLPLAINEIAVMQAPYTPIDGIGVETLLSHSSGQWIKFRFKVKPPKNDIQTIGSLISYIKRFALSSALCISGEDEDDDGNIGSGKDKKDEKITKEQMNLLNSLVKEKNIKREELLSFSSSLTGRDIKSSTSLSKDEMDCVLEYFKNEYKNNKEENINE